ncbi:MAG: hypothetical protein ACRCXC_04190 [Legionella sp.]
MALRLPLEQQWKLCNILYGVPADWLTQEEYEQRFKAQASIV